MSGFKKKVIVDGKEKKGACYEIMLGYGCNAKCIFCSQNFDDRKEIYTKKDTPIANDIITGTKKNFNKIGLTGGEPLIHPNIIKFIKLSKKVGYPFIRVQTNGIKLGDLEFVDKLLEAGVDYFKISVHHTDAKIHDKLVGVEGAFDNLIKGIKHIVSKNKVIGINIVLNKYNYNILEEFIEFFAELGASNFVIIFPLLEGECEKNWKDINITYTQVKPYLQSTLKRFWDENILVLNYPACFIKEYKKNIISDFGGTNVVDVGGEIFDIDSNKGDLNVYLDETCNNCPIKENCMGLQRKYIDFYGKENIIKELKNI